jgi:hypothetical protein
MINLFLLIYLFVLLYYFHFKKKSELFNDLIDSKEDIEDVYNYKTSKHFKKMFEQPTIWLGYQDFDGSENYNKVYVNNFKNYLFKEKIL